MIREYIGTGKTVEEAIEAACAALGCDREKIEFEILSLAKKSFFGLKVTPAQVKVTYEDGIPAPKAERPREKADPRPEKKQPAPAAGKPAKKEAAPQEAAPPAQEKKLDPEKKPAPEKKPEPPAEPKQEDLYHTAPLTDAIPEEVKPKADAAVGYLTDVIAKMGVKEFTITPKMRENTLVLMIEGSDLGVVIGRRGETLDSLQYLTSLVCNRGEGEYIRVNLDSGNYREKRIKTLEELAIKVARNAVRTGRSTTLEPMNPYDRRIIHASVSKVEGAVSTSVGEEPQRRVVISSANPRKGENRRGGSYRGGRGGRGARGGDRRRNDRDRRPSTSPAAGGEPSSKKTEPLKEAADKPLYGKIEL